MITAGMDTIIPQPPSARLQRRIAQLQCCRNRALAPVLIGHLSGSLRQTPTHHKGQQSDHRIYPRYRATTHLSCARHFTIIRIQLLVQNNKAVHLAARQHRVLRNA